MYWYEKSDDECIGYKYSYFEYRPLAMTLQIKTKYTLTHEEFVEWYDKNKSL